MTIHSTVSEIAAHFGRRAFTTSEAELAGVSSDRLQRASRAGLVQRLARGVYVMPDRNDVNAWHLTQGRAWRLQHDGVRAVIGTSAAAQRWGVPLMARPVGLPTIVTPTASRVRTGVRNGIRFLREDLDPDDIRTSPPGDLVTSPVRTAIDLIRHSRLAPRLAVATMSIAQRFQWRHDHSLTSQGLRSQLAKPETRDALAAASRASLSRTPNRGTSWLASGLHMCDPRLESVLEALAWCDFIEAGLPMPTPQAWVQGASGQRYCVDFLWEEHGVIGEADGAIKYSSPEEVLAEKARQADLEAAGYRFVRWTWADAIGVRSYVARLTLTLNVGSPRFPAS